MLFLGTELQKKIISDNDSQYASFKSKRFQKVWKFCHKTSSPRYPKSNGLAESTVRTVKKLVKKCSRSGQDLKKRYFDSAKFPH